MKPWEKQRYRVSDHQLVNGSRTFLLCTIYDIRNERNDNESDCDDDQFRISSTKGYVT